MIKLLPISKNIPKEDILQAIAYRANDIVFASGSLIQGIGNGKSDLDLFVVTDSFDDINKDVTYDQLNYKVGFCRVAGVNCDVEYWQIQVLEELIYQVNHIDFDDIQVRSHNQVKIDGYSSSDLTSFLHRFIISENVFNSNRYNSLLNNLNRNNYYKLMSRIYVNHVDNAYEDVIGNLEQREIETAMLMARETLVMAMTAYTFSKKKTTDRTKWTYKIMKELASTDKGAANILDQCDVILFPTALSKVSLENDIEQTLSLINHIITTINEVGGV